MRRADRLFQIIQLLRRRRGTTTAAWLAERLEVSERTVYRDVRDLVASGTPIEGEAGVGYRLRTGYDLPPLMFDRDEIQALALGARFVQTLGDAALARAGASVLAKVSAVLPAERAPILEQTRLFAPDLTYGAARSDLLGRVREALLARRKLRLDYADRAGATTTRTVRPLGAFFWARACTVAAFCELRGDFRHFRVDRVRALEILPDGFEDEPGRTLRDLLARYGPGAVGLLSG
jgi:predicted DNA-binding transcriptional regulator YafY